MWMLFLLMMAGGTYAADCSTIEMHGVEFTPGGHELKAKAASAPFVVRDCQKVKLASF